MQAIILAGGKGTRLRPYTTVLPKPLMPVGDIPILEVVLRQLKWYGFQGVTITVGHLAGLIETFFGDGSKFDLKIDYSLEDKPLGTAGPLSLIEGYADDFLVMNGDVLTTLNYGELMDYHLASGAIATIATHSKPVKIDLGVLEVDESGRLLDYIEKPTLNYTVSMGIYIFNRKVLDMIPREEYLDFPDLVKKLISAGEKIATYKSDDYWLDIGRHDDYEKSVEDFDKLKDKFLPDSC